MKKFSTNRAIDYGKLFEDLNNYFADRNYTAFMVRTALNEYLEHFDDGAELKDIRSKELWIKNQSK